MHKILGKGRFLVLVIYIDCKARDLNREDAMDRGRWKKLIKIR